MFSEGEAIQNWPEIGLILDIQDFDLTSKRFFTSALMIAFS